ncbi:hypothetical protein ACHAXA_011660 [Cyclostephanos tholiformis]|uniref:Protein kinase domain-containing protein n=1 Tax=Cyclostephanos tholiformis TaxID=382380 RepID=A0ABD3SEQ1_9STRA
MLTHDDRPKRSPTRLRWSYSSSPNPVASPSSSSSSSSSSYHGGTRSVRLLILAFVTYLVSVQMRSSTRIDVMGPRSFSSAPWISGRDGGGMMGGGGGGGGGGKLRRREEIEEDEREEEEEEEDEEIPSSSSTAAVEDAESRRRPRIVVIDYPPVGRLHFRKSSVGRLPSNYVVGSRHINRTIFEVESIPTDCPHSYCAVMTPSWHVPNSMDYIDEDTKMCEPMHEWQTRGGYPNCNIFHEVEMRKLRVINTGGSRIAFEMNVVYANDDVGGGGGSTETKFVYKTIKYHKDVTQDKVDEQRKDSLIMERTTKSKFIPDIYGYCSLAVMMDFMPEGNMHEYIKGARLAGGSTLPPVDRLRLSIHIATSVADLHTIDDTPMPSVFHNDLCCHQYLFQNGVFKLNDFNYARPIYVNKKTKEQCKRKHFGMAMWKARSLEEHMTHSGDVSFDGVNPDKVDVWMMGNLMYYMLTDLYTFERPRNLSWRDSGKELLAGRRSPLPSHIEESRDPSHVAVRNALDMCWTQKWEERPSARYISDYLLGRLRNITGEENPDLRVILPKRDPNMRGTDSEYEKYND